MPKNVAFSSQALITPKSFRDLSRVPRSVTRAYQSEFLERELPRIAAKEHPELILKEQISYYAEATSRPAPNSAHVTLGERGQLGKGHFMEGGLEAWLATADWRAANKPLVVNDRAAAFSGNFFLSNDATLKGDPNWKDFDQKVLQPRGIGNIAYVNYPIMFKSRLRIAIAYAFSDEVNGADLASRFEFDVLTIPFAIVWLYKFDVIDFETMAHWLSMLSGLTPAKLFLVREIVNAPRYQASIVRERTGLSKRNIENHLYQLSEILEAKVPREPGRTGYGSILTDVANSYRFLSFTGRPVFGSGEASAGV